MVTVIVNKKWEGCHFLFNPLTFQCTRHTLLLQSFICLFSIILQSSPWCIPYFFLLISIIHDNIGKWCELWLSTQIIWITLVDKTFINIVTCCWWDICILSFDVYYVPVHLIFQISKMVGSPCIDRIIPTRSSIPRYSTLCAFCCTMFRPSGIHLIVRFVPGVYLIWTHLTLVFLWCLQSWSKVTLCFNCIHICL